MAGKQAVPEVMTVNDLCKYLHVHHSRAMELVTSGQIPGRKIGAYWRVHKQAADNWLMGIKP